MKTHFFIFVFVSVALFIVWSSLNPWSVRIPNDYNLKFNVTDILKYYSGVSSEKSETKSPRLKNILIWTSPKTEPMVFMGYGQTTFIERKCAVNNCFVTSRRNDLPSIKDFDAILFHAPEIVHKLRSENTFPVERSMSQKFVFVSMESAGYYPVCEDKINNYFNWTFTYKVNSDIYFGYIVVRDENGVVIGPKENMHWIDVEDMEPINETIKEKLKDKKLAGAWFVSNCKAPSGRDSLVHTIQQLLRKYGYDIDIFGNCGTNKCPRNDMASCLRMIQKDYYFYFSMENSFGDDYVTEKLLHGLQNYAIPVVYGLANYTRFIPEGTYLDAKRLSPASLVEKMLELMNDKEKYYKYFRWHNHYSFHAPEDAPDTDCYCKLCEQMNNDEIVRQNKVISDFKNWWSPAESRQLCRH